MVSSAKSRASTLSTPSAVQSHFAMSAENRMRLDDSLRNGSARDSLAADSSKPIATLSGRPLLSNRGIPLSLDWLKQVRINTSAVERRAQTHVARRTVKKDWQAAWLLRAISCMDLTTLSGDDTEERVRRLCAKARQPIQHDLVQRLGIEELNNKVAAVCVYHTFVETALRALEGSGVRGAAGLARISAGLFSFTERGAEIHPSLETRAQGNDVVITPAPVFCVRRQ